MEKEEKRYEVFNKDNSDARFFYHVIFGVFVSLFLILGFLILKPADTLPVQEVKADEDVLTVVMNASFLVDALEEHASDWCEVSRTIPIIGDIILSNPENKTGQQMYDLVFLTDSVAPIMAREYPHLFEFTEKNGKKSFKMNASRTAVTVPVWLVKELLERRILQLPDETPTNREEDL